LPIAWSMLSFSSALSFGLSSWMPSRFSRTLFKTSVLTIAASIASRGSGFEETICEESAGLLFALVLFVESTRAVEAKTGVCDLKYQNAPRPVSRVVARINRALACSLRRTSRRSISPLFWGVVASCVTIGSPSGRFCLVGFVGRNGRVMARDCRVALVKLRSLKWRVVRE
jgi:hypothetical protein